MPETTRIVQALEAATTRPEVSSALREATRSLGFDCFSLTTEIVNPGGDTWRVVLSDTPVAFLQWYRDLCPLARDPLTDRAARAVAPVFSDDSWDEGQAAEVERFIRAAGMRGFSFALVVPHHAQGGSSTFCTFWRQAPPEGMDRANVGARGVLVAALAHTAASRAVERRSEPRTISVLSASERACLTLLAQGHTAKEVGQQMGIAARTVAYYLQRAMQKYGANKPREAIARALMCGEITTVDMSPRPWSVSDRLVDAAGPAQLHVVGASPLKNEWAHISRAPCFEALAASARRCAALMGFPHFAYVMRAPVGRERCFQAVLTNYPPPLRAVGENPAQAREDPVVGGSEPTALPVFWEYPHSTATGCQEMVPTHFGLTASVVALGGALSKLCLAGNTPIAVARCEVTQSVGITVRLLHGRAAELTPTSTAFAKLSRIEIDSLKLMASGFGLKNVATLMTCTTRTARYRLGKLARKVGAASIQEAVSKAIQHGVLPPTMDRERHARICVNFP